MCVCVYVLVEKVLNQSKRVPIELDAKKANFIEKGKENCQHCIITTYPSI